MKSSSAAWLVIVLLVAAGVGYSQRQPDPTMVVLPPHDGPRTPPVKLGLDKFEIPDGFELIEEGHRKSGNFAVFEQVFQRRQTTLQTQFLETGHPQVESLLAELQRKGAAARPSGSEFYTQFFEEPPTKFLAIRDGVVLAVRLEGETGKDVYDDTLYMARYHFLRKMQDGRRYHPSWIVPGGEIREGQSLTAPVLNSHPWQQVIWIRESSDWDLIRLHDGREVWIQSQFLTFRKPDGLTARELRTGEGAPDK